MREIKAKDWTAAVVDLWMNRWLLLTSGTLEACNMMTVAWGSIGCMWNKPFAQVVVRPQRHTRGFIDRSDSFTLCAFPKAFRKDLNLLGTLSGRDGDKLAKTRLTLTASKRVAAPCYREADLILECQKIYFQDMDPEGFVDSKIKKNYPDRDYHRIYFGEIVSVFVS
ncbi:MAG: flavin reductase family protein [Candidatus Aminicenantes bacterium]|nr:flavin reductase family protein [Candidatus Aminicenantes bacterium]